MTHAAYILAGGQSKRFGSDKALSVIKGKTLLQHNIDLASATHEKVYLSTDRPDRYPEYKLHAVIDEHLHLGPMNGILNCLKHAHQTSDSHTKIMIFSCDLWDLTPRHVKLLQSHALKAPAAKTWLFHDEFPQVTYGIYHTSLIPDLDASIEKKQLSMTRWIRTHQEICHFLNLPTDLPTPISINTPNDLKRITNAVC